MLKLKTITIGKACTSKFGKNDIKQKQLDDFEFELKQFYNKFNALNENETEEHFKNIFRDFLLKAFYENKNYINTKSFAGLYGTDLVIHETAEVNSRVEVLFEFKRPSNKSGMITMENLNRKAMFEAVLYYLQERMGNNNIELKYIIITNLAEFFIFDAKQFQKLFHENSVIRNIFSSWSSHQTDDDSTKQMYDVISRQICEMDKSIEAVHFNLNDFTRFNSKTNKAKIKQLYQILSPKFLFKETAKQDSNELNKDFYNELLYIMGLEEYKEKNKKLIRRCEKSQSGSLLENTISQMKTHTILHPENYGENTEEQQFNYALQMNITWINRILFLKLLEAQLISYHNSDLGYAFLSYNKVNSYNDLADLFFKVLALKEDERQPYIKENYPNLPYLNSSLFDRSSQEQEVSITELTNLEISIYAKTVLKVGKKRISGKMNTLEYLLRFLDAFNFGSKIVPEEEKKTLINASVLGLIFEKINGYKEGSFYTPGYITMYMSRETLRRSVLDKLNIAFEREFTEFDELRNYTNNIYKSEELQKANEVLNSITICDPAVGSGHFLVSILNEMITIKSELGILCDTEGTPRRDWNIQVINDELNIHDGFGEPFDYKLNEIGKPHSELQNIQETLFHEKQTIIENCLFGVDINPNSVNICRLRLWIELLKNSYYTKDSNFKFLHTLPNIDINIKCGNSLISRFNLGDSLTTVLQKTNMTVTEYLTKVRQYKNATNKQEKLNLIIAIDEIKSKFKKQMMHLTDVYRKFARLERKYKSFFEDQDMFEENRKIKQNKKEFERTEKAYNKAKDEWEVWESGEVYRNAFEWRFEFPEVLDETGKFIGFDIVIGNPPWVSLVGKQKSLIPINTRLVYKSEYPDNTYMPNLYEYFVSKGIQIFSKNGYLTFIIPDRFGHNKSISYLREKIIEDYKLLAINYRWKFPEVIADTMIVFIGNQSVEDYEIPIQHNRISDIVYVPKSEIIKNHNYVLKSFSNNKSKTLINKILYNSSDLISYIDVTSGFGANSKLITSSRINDNQIPIIKGASFQKYSPISFSYYNFVKKNLKGRTTDPEKLGKMKKILIRKTGKDIIATYCNTGEFPEQSVYFLYDIKKDYSYNYLLALINSRLVNWFYQNYLVTNLESTAQMKSYDLEKIPIIYNKDNDIRINELVESLLDNLNPVSSEIILLKIDIFTYKLYNLTYEEVLIVDPEFALSQEEYEKFEVKL
ncbi:MAG: TaqI-like C-terminal specificity domain-containing protein [Candidatus Cloacimonadota bacterium]|nr:TaqI-like C-terminal specificity domain-containing protein [Candidatus Cloacimonadota bacterium]